MDVTINTLLVVANANADVRNALAQTPVGSENQDRFTAAEDWLDEKAAGCWPRVGEMLLGEVYTAEQASRDVTGYHDAIAELRRIARILGIPMSDTSFDHS